jgi:hypothetical protein
MISQKKIMFGAFILMLSFFGNAFAQTCYDPNNGYYYECNPNYSYYPDQGQALLEGALLGIIIGGAFNNNQGSWGGGGNWGGGYHHHGGGDGGGDHGHGGGGGHRH